MALVSPIALTVAWWITAAAAGGREVGTGYPRGLPALLAAGMTAAAWLVADLRRRESDTSGLGLALLVGGGWWPTTVFLPVAVLTGIALGTASLPALAVAAVTLAALAVVSGRAAGHAVAVVLVVPAPLLAAPYPGLVAAAGLGGALVLAGAAVVRARMNDRGRNAPLAWMTAFASLVPLGGAWLVVHLHWSIAGGTDATSDATVPALVAAVALVVAATLVAAALDHGAVQPDVDHLGMVGRLAALATLTLVTALPTDQIAVVAGVICGIAVVDALRRREPLPLFALPIAAPVLVGSAALAAGLTLPEAGIALCVLAAVAAGIDLVLPEDWGLPVLATVIASGLGGLAAATGDVGASGTALILLGAIGAAYSIVHRSTLGAIGAGVVVTVGVWAHLVEAEVTVLDAYLAPVAIGLMLAGLKARTAAPRVSSWVAYGPAIVVLGGSALLERLQGGDGIHALVAGTVAVAAVLTGGGRRLVGPLLLGTALLVTLTVHESLDVTRTVPTWGWLALGGTVLLSAGIAMERLDTTPVETGRRLVDVVQERFS
jgi:hypothetical protein